MANNEKNIGLYLHIPFCKSKCLYCDFYSLSGREDYERYTDALIMHMEDYSAALRGCTVDSIYIGGGTPTAMPTSMICTLIDGIFDNFNVSDNAEITIECNPATVGIKELKKIRSAGVNRLSIGIQSACDSELRSLGRIHNFSDAEECFYAARKAGFDNINVDIMYGIPGQTPESLSDTLGKVCGLDPEHISFYGLKIEEGTPFYDMSGSLELPDEDTESAMYFDSIALLSGHGYDQYEISNFAKEGFACRHNIKYWSCGEYLGLGPGAHSYLGGCRFSFKKDIDRYISSMEHPEHDYGIIDEKYNIRDFERIGEYVMLRLRTVYGVDAEEFKRRFDRDFDIMYGDKLYKYIEGGFAKKSGNRYFLTPRGMYVSNYILSDLLDFDGSMAAGAAEGMVQ